METDDLNRQFMALKEDFSQLGMHLATASRHLQDSGMLPPPELIEAMVAARSDLDMFRNRLLSEAQAVALHPDPEDGLASLEQLESLLQTIAHAHEAKGEAEALRHCALTMLTRVMTIKHYGSTLFEPLVEIQNNARDLREAVSNSSWADLHPETEILANGGHPFSQLIALVEQQEQLDDDEWVYLQEVVAHAFGKAMSVAAARGKLFLAECISTEDQPACIDTQHEETTLSEHIPHTSLSCVDTDDNNAIDEDQATVAITREERAQETAVLAHDEHVVASHDDEVEEPFKQPEPETTLAIVNQIKTETAHPSEPHHASVHTDTPDHMLDNDVPYNPHAMKQADLDRFLKQQLDSVRQDVASRQKHGFIKSFGRKFK